MKIIYLSSKTFLLEALKACFPKLTFLTKWNKDLVTWFLFFILMNILMIFLQVKRLFLTKGFLHFNRLKLYKCIELHNSQANKVNYWIYFPGSISFELKFQEKLYFDESFSFHFIENSNFLTTGTLTVE